MAGRLLGQDGQASHLAQVMTALPVDEAQPVSDSGLRPEDQLHEEVIAHQGPVTRLLGPGRQRFLARGSQLVHALVGPVRLDHILAADEPGTLKPLQGHIDLADVRRGIRSAECLLQPGLQFIPVSRLLGQQREQVEAHDVPPPSASGRPGAIVMNPAEPKLAADRSPDRRRKPGRMRPIDLYLTEVYNTLGSPWSSGGSGAAEDNALGDRSRPRSSPARL